jgi:hypothetical protein
VISGETTFGKSHSTVSADVEIAPKQVAAAEVGHAGLVDKLAAQADNAGNFHSGSVSGQAIYATTKQKIFVAKFPEN